MFKRLYNPEQDIVGVLIEIAEHNRRAASLSSYDFGWQIAEYGLSPAANLRHYLHVGAFSQREVLGFDKGTVKTDIPQPALLYFATVTCKHHYVGHATLS